MSGTALLVSPSSAPGGAERALVGLARRLPEIGVKPEAVLLADGPLRFWLEAVDCPVTICAAGRARQLPTTVSAIRMLAEHARNADVVVSNQSKGHIYGGLAARLAGVHEIWWQQGDPGRNLLELIAAVVPGDAVVCSNRSAARAQRRITPFRRVEVIHLGTELDQVRLQRGRGLDIRTRMDWDGHPVIGIVGRLQPWKGQEIFLRAASRVSRTHPEARFAVIGGAILGWEGDYPERLVALARSLGIEGATTFTGHQHDIYPWFDALDVVIHASFGEPFGLVLIEAMALGKPLIATAAGGPTEIIQDGVSGLLVPPGDDIQMAAAINRVLSDPSLARSLGRAAEGRANAFSDDAMARRFVELFSDLGATEPLTQNRPEIPSDAMAGEGTHDLVFKLLDAPRTGVVLDIGAGLGGFSERLSAGAYQAVGLGVVAGQFQARGVPFVCCDVDRGFPFGPASLAGVVAIELIEHLEAPLLFFREASRCLQSGGWLVVTTPNILSIASKLSFAFRDRMTYFGEDEYATNGHISPVSIIDMQRIAERCGLATETVTYSVGKIPLPRIRHRYPLRGARFRNQYFGESIIVKMRKVGAPVRDVARG